MAAQPTHLLDNAPDVTPSSPHPDDDHDQSTSLEPDDDPDPTLPHLQAQTPPPKRKGGRKPIYATVEERKQRNRQAQAAFRERRTEYIKELENTLKQQEEILQNSQRDRQVTSYQIASLQGRIHALERILHEHGVDIEAEVRARGEQAFMTPETPSLSAFNNQPGSGLRRPLKQNGTSGTTKLDLLKAKAAATARDSMISPVNSPQSQTSVWNEHSSPHSTVMTSPMTADRDAAGQVLYPIVPHPDFAQQHPGVALGGTHPMAMEPGFSTHDASFRPRQTHSSMDGAINARADHSMRSRLSAEWGTYLAA